MKKYQDIQMKEKSHVFLDISIDDVKCGRVVIELFKDHVPKTAENFRALCTGERGIGELNHPLHYKNSIFHKAVPECIVQGGDITNYDGSGGESIYGPYFDDESLELLHSEAGLLSMANCEKPNTNSSQFCVTLGELPYLDGTYVVFGRVLKGFNIINDISYQPLGPGDRPIATCKIWDCGEIKPDQDWGFRSNDYTDVYAPYPQDEEMDPSDLQVSDILEVIQNIKTAGNEFFRLGDYLNAHQKYKKALRYLDWFEQWHGQALVECKTQCRMNAALVCNKLKYFREAIYYCNLVLAVDPTNVKALFRRAMARKGLNEHQEALHDLHLALQITPNDPVIIGEISRIQRVIANYQESERLRCLRMFRT